MVEKKFLELVNILKKLRKECPWDREQTNDSIKAATIEEAYEVVEAIDEKNYDELKNELGDLLLHIVFHSQIAEDNSHFTLSDVIDGITSKLIRRHPHVFKNTKVSGTEEIKKNWETIKLQEGRDSVLEGVPENLPALLKAYRIQEKASKIGFDWKNKDDVWVKVLEEIKEFKNAEKLGNINDMENEMGDILFALTNYCRFLNINPENALRKSNKKFINRFQYIENKLKENGKNITETSLEEMDKLWDESKKTLK